MTLQRTVLGLLGLMALVGCGEAARVSHESPEALWVSYEEAVLARDYDVILADLAPDQRPAFVELLAAHEQYAAAGQRLQELLRDRFDAVKAYRFRKGIFEPFDQMFEQHLIGSLPPGMNYGFRGDGAVIHLTIDEVDTGLVLASTDGLWHVRSEIAGEEESTVENMMPLTSLLASLTVEFEATAEGIVNGTINDENIADTIVGGR